MSVDQIVSRIDPENHRGVAFHAQQALNNRFSGITNPAERRAAIESAPFRNTAAHDGEAESMRVEMLALLDRLEGKLTPEQLALRTSLESQAGAAASVWTEKFPIEDGHSKEKLKIAARTWLESLSPKVLEGFRTLCPDTASVVVVPPLPVPALLKLLKSGRKSSTIRWDYWERVGERVSDESWKVGITDGREDMPFDPAIYWENEAQEKKRTNKAMVDKYKGHFEAHGLGLMPPHGYVPSAARALAEGKVLDEKFFTAFKQPEDAALLPIGRWYVGGLDLDLDGGVPGNSHSDLRCRSWVEGEMKF